MSGRGDGRMRVARIAVGAVFLMNVQSALRFILWPGRYAARFELIGVPGETALRGLGIAFLMWNATYPLVLWDPRRHRTLFGVIIVQQLIGLVGESWLLLTLPAGHEALAASITRFVAFDGAGLALLAAAFVLSRETDRIGA